MGLVYKANDSLLNIKVNGVLHRDLKPSNIIIVEREDGERIPKIVDFGIARIGSSDQRLTATGVGIGSPLYISPEQARNNLESLALTGFKFSDSILPHLTESKTLKHLQLGDTQVTAERLSSFVAQKKSLRRLAIREQDLSDQLLREIGQSNIESLDFAGSPMTRSQLELMVANGHISSLGLQAGNPFAKQAKPLLGEQEFTMLQRCRKLKALTLYKVRTVPDEAIDAIARLKVEELKFETCNIADKQLLRLAPMKMLRKLDFFRAESASNEGVKELEKRLNEKWNKNCQITFLSEEEYQIKYQNK